MTPKTHDYQTPLERLEKWRAKTYSDTLQKYEDLRGAPLFIFTESEDIFKAIDKAGIKPSDGLNTLLSKASTIQDSLKDEPLAKEHFDWFIETMQSVEKDIPNAIKGAWKDGKFTATPYSN